MIVSGVQTKSNVNLIDAPFSKSKASTYPKNFKSYYSHPEVIAPAKADGKDISREFHVELEEQFPNPIVEFNVGGIIYATSRDTLLKDASRREGFLKYLKKCSDNNGKIFIDRDGEYFKYILNYLRDGVYAILPEAGTELHSRLIIECKYYNLTDLSTFMGKRPHKHSRRSTPNQCEFNNLKMRGDGCYMMKPPTDEEQTDNNNNCEILTLISDETEDKIVVMHFKQLINKRGKKLKQEYARVKDKDSVYQSIQPCVHDDTLTEVTYIELISSNTLMNVADFEDHQDGFKNDSLGVFLHKGDDNYANVIRMVKFQVRPKEFLSTTVRIFEYSNIAIEEGLSLYFG
ncbi:BTB/POZ domain-containing protein [Acrasis kona]|uniref:BTB/POZ domain-containing protein n=1 Tax=Acrasis kona TaxID=1008807 RepID=A0AAW2YSE1_9EUKA